MLSIFLSVSIVAGVDKIAGALLGWVEIEHAADGVANAADGVLGGFTSEP